MSVKPPEVFMNHPNPQSFVAPDDATQPEDTTFAEMLSNFEQQHGDGAQTVQGLIVSVSSDAILVDIGRKTEGALPMATWREQHDEQPAVGASISVSVGGFAPEGYYRLSLLRVERPKDWTALEQAFAEKKTIMGTVAEQVKGGFRVDIGVRAFMPASRSGVREADEMVGLVGQEVPCRITKLDVPNEDVVVDRRVVLEEEHSSMSAEWMDCSTSWTCPGTASPKLRMF
jgi:small subunit ribosomal protein S1